MDEEAIWKIANKRARYALSQIANNQMNTWRQFHSADEPVDIIARQIAEGMNDALQPST